MTRRSVWKGPFTEKTLTKKITKQVNKSKPILTWSRKSLIVPEYLGYKFSIHNGKKHIDIVVNQDMVGHKFGEFALTRQITKHKVKKKNLKKKK